MSTVVIADDYPLTLRGTKSYVEELGYKVLDICSNGLTAYQKIVTQKPVLAILDVEMPGMTGLEVLEKVYREKLRTKIIFLTMHTEYSIYRKAEQFDLAGYLIKDKASELEECLKEVLAGKKYVSNSLKSQMIIDSDSASENALDRLTLMEKRIIELIIQQKTSKQIAELFFVSEKLIEKHRGSIIEKLGLPKEKNVLLKWALQNYNQ